VAVENSRSEDRRARTITLPATGVSGTSTHSGLCAAKPFVPAGSYAVHPIWQLAVSSRPWRLRLCVRCVYARRDVHMGRDAAGGGFLAFLPGLSRTPRSGPEAPVFQIPWL